MSNFLWVEDFAGENATISTTNAIFGSLLTSQGLASISKLSEEPRGLKKDLRNHGIFLEFNFYDAYCFIHKKLNTVDYIVLDIDLPCHGDYFENDAEVFGLLSRWDYIDANYYEDEHRVKNAKVNLGKIAGYHLYTELIYELGFPKENILFCSNHGEELKTIRDSFSQAKLDIPKIYNKSQSIELHKWIDIKNANEYTQLRRGIILASDKFKKNLESKKHITRFSPKWIYENEIYKSEYFTNYLDLLALVLPIREPDGKNGDRNNCYKLLVRCLVHNWDQTSEKIERDDDLVWYALTKILRHCRNWSSHNRKLFTAPTTTFLAFLFLVNMRAIFKMDTELAEYEKILLPLLGVPLIQEELSFKKEHINETLNFFYVEIKELSGKDDDFYDQLISKIQQDVTFSPPENISYNDFFQNCLYRVMWFVLAQKKPLNSFNYPKLSSTESDLEMFVCELERYIYKLSFPNA
jgi:hypothetical protein